MIYEFSINNTNLSFIHKEVEASAMTDKTIESCRWDEATLKLFVSFTNELSADDKIILDGIVTNSNDNPYSPDITPTSFSLKATDDKNWDVKIDTDGIINTNLK